MAALVESDIGFANRSVDPCTPALLARLRAAVDDGLEVMVEPDLEALLADRLPEAPGHMEPVQRDDAARFGPYPEHFRIAGAFRHWEHAGSVGLQEQVWRDTITWSVRAGHGHLRA